MTNSNTKQNIWPVAIFASAYTIAALIFALAKGNTEFLFYIVVMLVLGGAILFVHRRVGFTTPLLWLLSVWGLMHMAGGLVPVPESWPIAGDIRVLYSWWIIPDGTGSGFLKYDHITHAYGFGVTTWLCWQALCGAMRGKGVDDLSPTFGLLTLCAVAACGFGAANEIVEFVATMIAETNVGGYVNTGWDLVANATGATIAAILIAASSR